MIVRIDDREFRGLTKEVHTFESPLMLDRDCMVETTAHVMNRGFRVLAGSRISLEDSQYAT